MNNIPDSLENLHSLKWYTLNSLDELREQVFGISTNQRLLLVTAAGIFVGDVFYKKEQENEDTPNIGNKVKELRNKWIENLENPKFIDMSPYIHLKDAELISTSNPMVRFKLAQISIFVDHIIAFGIGYLQLPS
jgi:hypothetical protein